MVKDILAMANAWKTSDAYVLVGVDENPGGRARVVGVFADNIERPVEVELHVKVQTVNVFDVDDIPGLQDDE